MEHSFGSTEGVYDESMCFQSWFSGPEANSKTDKFSAAVAALTLAFCRGCGGDSNTDDIVMVSLRQLSPGECT